METEISIKLLQGRHRLVITGDLILLPILLNSLIIKISPEPTVLNPAPEPSNEIPSDRK